MSAFFLPQNRPVPAYSDFLDVTGVDLNIKVTSEATINRRQMYENIDLLLGPDGSP